MERKSQTCVDLCRLASPFAQGFTETPCLWNKESPFFKNKSTRNAALEELRQSLNEKSITQIKGKFHSLRTSFARESKNPHSEWKFLRQLDFLKEDGEERYTAEEERWSDEDVTCLIDYYRGKRKHFKFLICLSLKLLVSLFTTQI